MKSLLTRLLAGTLVVAAGHLSAQSTNPRYTAYIDQFAPLAVMEMHSSGIPASITLAQGLLESGAGSSTLATQANNHFGIKCHGDWTGRSMYRKDDDRNKHGKLIESCFRSYEDPAQSYADHSEFLVNGRRYAGLFMLKPTDYKGWAKGLKKAGYATSKTYASKLIDLIERYELHRYDRGNFGLAVAGANQPAKSPTSGPVISNGKPASSTRQRPALSGAAGRVASAPAERTTEAITPSVAPEARELILNDVKFTYAKPGEGITDVARRTRRRSRDLIRFNEAADYAHGSLAAGTRVFLQPKRKSFRGKQKTHTVRRGETMQRIADSYAIQTAALYQRNRMPEGAQPRQGESIYLRGRRPKRNDVRILTTKPTRPAVAQVSMPAPPPQQRAVEVQAAPTRPPATAPSTASSTVEHTRPTTQASPRPATRTVTVQSGDTLWALSRRVGVDVADLKQANGLASNTIQPGQRLVIP